MSSKGIGLDSLIENARPMKTFLLLFVVLIPVIAALAILYRQALPVPYQDDYATVLSFAANYDQLPSFTAKALYIATAQSNEYKLGLNIPWWPPRSNSLVM